MPRKKVKAEPVTQKVEIEEEWEGNHDSVVTWEGVVTIDQRIIDAVDDDWRSHFYRLTTVEQIASHIAYNFIVNGVYRVNRLDGFANLPDDVVFELEAN